MRTIKSILSNPFFLLLLRTALGSVFVLSGLDKVIALDAFTQSILHYHVVGVQTATLIATVLPWLEILCGLGIILGIASRASAILITALLLLFTVLVISAMIRGLDISCGCFTQDPTASKIGWYKILENLVMIAAGMVLTSIRHWSLTIEDSFLFRRK